MLQVRWTTSSHPKAPFNTGWTSKMAAHILNVEQMCDADPDATKRVAEWSLWHKSTQKHMVLCMVDALGLRRDPTRGRTHIVLKEILYVPKANNPEHKFCVCRCGVFRIQDVLSQLETLLNLAKGDGPKYIAAMLDNVPGVKTASDGAVVPFLHFSGGEDLWATDKGLSSLESGARPSK